MTALHDSSLRTSSATKWASVPDSARVETGAVVRIGDEVYAIGDRCSHADVSLSEGTVDPDDRTIECFKHGSTFDLRTGEPQSLPATRPVPVYDVRVRDGLIVMETP